MNAEHDKQIAEVRARSTRLQTWVFIACLVIVTFLAVLVEQNADTGMVLVLFGPPTGGAVGYLATLPIANRTNTKVDEIKRQHRPR